MVQLDLFGRAPEVIIDVHEISGTRDNAVKLFMKMLEREKVYFRIEKLEVGDVILPKGYAIERKTVKDFINSISRSKNGRLRLFEQMRNLVSTYENPILLLEGGLSVVMDPLEGCIYVPLSSRKLSDRILVWTMEKIKIHPNSFEGLLREIQNMGVTVIKSFDAEHGARILMGLLTRAKSEATVSKKDSEKYAIIRSKPKSKTLLDQQLFFLSGLPGINTARAEKLLMMYKTPKNAILKVERWDTDVNGIGEKTIERVKKILETKYEDAKNKEPV